MTDVFLFHHAQGLTEGVVAFADRLRDGGHSVTTPDSYEGATFDDLDAGVAHAKSIGFEEVQKRAIAAAQDVGGPTVYAGMSLGVMAAQQLAQTRETALGAVAMHAAVPLGFYGQRWPDGVGLQIHVMEDDDWGDVPEAKDLAAAVDDAELFLYPGADHLFTDSSLSVHDADATDLVVERMLAFLDRIDASG